MMLEQGARYAGLESKDVRCRMGIATQRTR